MIWQRARKRARRGQIEYLVDQYDLAGRDRNFGWSAEAAAIPRNARNASDECKRIIKAAKASLPVVLWPYLFKVWPSWHWGLQGTGDCVSWGTGHMADVTMAVQLLAMRIRRPDALICQESIYGFGKSELYNSYRYNWQGMAGADGVESFKKFGTLYRKNYALPDGGFFDLTEYDGGRAVIWGSENRGTEGVPNILEPFAAEHKAKDFVQVTDGKSAAALLESGIATQYCGGYAYWPLGRDSNGLGTNITNGAHCMTLVGVMYDASGNPEWGRIANVGHGDHVGGPAEVSLPNVGAPPQVYQECGGWMPWKKYIEPILADGDCYAVTFVEGWDPLDLTDLGFGGSL